MAGGRGDGFYGALRLAWLFFVPSEDRVQSTILIAMALNSIGSYQQNLESR